MDEIKDAAPVLEAEPPLSYPTEKQRRVLWRAVTALALVTLFAIAGLIFFGFITFLSWAYPVLLPIGLAVIIALVLEPIVNFAQKRGLHRQAATLGVSILSVVAFLLFWAFLLPPLVTQAGTFFYSLPVWINEGIDKLQNLETKPEEITPQGTVPLAVPPATNSIQPGSPPPNPTATNQAPAVVTPPPPPAPARHGQKAPPSRRIVIDTQMRDWIKTNIPAFEQQIQNNVAHLIYSIVGPVGQALGFALGFSFVPIYVYYFLADQDHITRHWHDYVPLRNSPLRNEVVTVLTEINEVLVRYFRGQIIVAACNGILTFIGLYAIGVPQSLVLGIMAGALSIVPFLGIIVSILPALLLGFLSSQGWLRPLGVLIVFTLVQMTESMLITPRVQSHSTGLHPLAIIIGILFWSMLLPGLLGPVVAVPLTCAVVVLMRRYVWQLPAAKIA